MAGLSEASPRPAGGPAPRVIYIGGVGRSGSTLLAGMLAQQPRVQLVGELVHIWDRGVLDNELCECGANFHACPFWAAVGDYAFGGWDRDRAHAMLALKMRVDRTRYVPLMTTDAAPGYSTRLRRYAGVLRRLYESVAAVTGADTIVDSSKHVSYAYVLRSMDDLDIRTVHLVRDSRGVAHSWTRKVRRVEITASETFMPQYSPVRVAARWNMQNLLLTALASPSRPVLLSRYEDLAAEPRPEFERILAFGSLDRDADLGFIDGNEVDLKPSHSIGGNPMRFESGPVEVRVDDRWRSDMPESDRRLVTNLTRPLLYAYGYRP